MRRNRIREGAFLLLFLLAAGALLHLAGAILRPAHTNYGSTWDAYLAEPEDTIDVLYLGSSYAYCDWNPAITYEETGLTGYVMGGSEQPPNLTYWYLREALKTQHPSVVVMEVSSLLFDRYQNYTQINVGYMPWGLNRVGATLTAAEPSLRLGLFWDLYLYHDRWKELTWQDLTKVFTPASTDAFKGYTYVDAHYDRWAEGPVRREVIHSQEIYEEHLAALGKIAALCEEKGIDFIATVNPTYNQYDPEVYEKLARDVARVAPQARFYDWSNAFDALHLSPERHLYDVGHLNWSGALLFSRSTGRLLLDLGYVPRPQTAENAAAWDAVASEWQWAIDIMDKEEAS